MKAVLKHPERGGARQGWGLQIAGWVTAGVFLAPLIYLLWVALSGTGLAAGVGAARIGPPLLRSVVLAAATAIATAVIGIPMAWMTMRTDIRGRRIWRVLAALPLAIPSYVGASALRAAFGPGGLVEWLPRPSGFWGALVALSVLTYPYVYLPVAVKLARMPASIEDAAKLLGDGTFRVMRRIVLPQLRLPILAGGLISFLYALSDFGAVSLMRYDTVTRVIYSSRLADPDTATVLAVLLGALAIAIALTERRFARREEGETFAIGEGKVYALGRLRPWLSVATGAFVTSVLASPVVVFAVWWWRGSVAAGSAFAEMAENLVSLVEPAANSAMAGALAGLTAILCLLPAAYLRRDGRSWAGTISNVAVAATFALPGLVLALSLVYWVFEAPTAIASLYQTLPLLILVYVIHFGVQSHRASADAVQTVPERYREAAKVLGAGRFRRFLSVEVPLIAPGVVVGGGLVMLSALKELPATLLLAPIGFDTLATRIWGAAEEGFLAEMGATSLALMSVSAVLTWVLILRPTTLRSSQ